MDERSKKADDAQGSTPGSFRKKIVNAIVIFAVIVLAVVLIAKFVFNTDLLNTASVEMLKRWR